MCVCVCKIFIYHIAKVSANIYGFYNNQNLFVLRISYMIVLPRNMLEQIITDDYKDVVNHMFTKLHADLGQPKTEENILQLKLLQNALTEHLVFANRLHGLKVDINVV